MAAAHHHHGHDHHDHGHDHHHHGHDDHVHDEHCGHSHGPTPDQLAGPGGWQRGLGAIFAVGLRPCSGAILVLVFALAQGLFWAGIAATFVMGLGTAITVATIAVRRRVRQRARAAAQFRARRRRHADHARHRIRRGGAGAAVRPRPAVRLSRRRAGDVLVERSPDEPTGHANASPDERVRDIRASSPRCDAHSRPDRNGQVVGKRPSGRYASSNRRRKPMAKLNINGTVRDVQVEADTPLLWVIREQIGLTGTKYGCGVAQCGACSVHINGEVQRSCSIPRRRREADRQDRHHRGPVGRFLASGAKGVGRGRRAAMRLLPVRPDHGGRGAAEEEAQADRPGHRRGDDQYLPMRHLSAHPRGGAHGCRRRAPPAAGRQGGQP